jgi:iduronate 2-sulfatase
MGRAIRTERHRLVEWRNPGQPENKAEWELYDYEADPLERHNLAREQPDVIAKLKSILRRHPEPVQRVNAQPTRKLPEPTR